MLEVAIATEGDPAPVGDVFLGRVRAVDRDLNAAFIDCGLDRDGYLDRRDAPGKGPLAKRLQEGQPLLVQVRRAAEGGKAMRLTTRIALAGLHLVLRPGQPGIGPTADGQGHPPGIAALSARMAKLVPAGGIELRPSAVDASDAELVAEADRLRALCPGIQRQTDGQRAPIRLHGGGAPAVRLLHGLMALSLGRIVAGDPATLARLRQHLEAWAPGLVEGLALAPDPFRSSGAAEQLQAALEPEVELAGGGRLIIEPAAALVAIDVDGGGRQALEVDLEAAAEIAHQLRLRRIGGTIVVDFVDLTTKPERARLLSAVEVAFRADPAPVQVLPMTAFGLVQIRRQRLGPSLAEQLSRTCPTCAGSGRLLFLDQEARA